jgi:hypothetical protein
MSGSDPNRDYCFVDPQELDAMPLEPLDMMPEQALEEALLDIIQLSEAEGVTVMNVDAALRRIVNDRAARTRSRFVVHHRHSEEA